MSVFEKSANTIIDLQGVNANFFRGSDNFTLKVIFLNGYSNDSFGEVDLTNLKPAIKIKIKDMREDILDFLVSIQNKTYQIVGTPEIDNRKFTALLELKNAED